MTAKNVIAVRRNTATLTSQLVECPVYKLLADEVPEGSMVFSFDPSVPANEHLVWAIDKDATREWTQHIERPFNLVNWVCKRVNIPNLDSGELSPAVRVVFIDDEGETVSFSSAGIAASLDLLRTLRGDGPYSPPVPIVFYESKTRRGFSTKKFSVPSFVKPKVKTP